MEIAAVPGVAIAVVDRGKASFICAGVARRRDEAEAANPITEHTVFAAASLSKQLAAEAVLDLAARARWDLDRPLGDFVQISASPDAGKVTARQVLSHSSGFPNWRFEKGQALKPAAEPGKAFRYSGEGYVYLQRVIEKISGQPFARYMREKVLDPLGMKSSTFTWQTPANAAQPHDRQGVPRDTTKERAALDRIAAETDKVPEDWNCADLEAASAKLGRSGLPDSFAINAAASLKCSASDYAKFLAAAMRRRRREFGERQVDMVPSSLPAGAGKLPVLGWGLGWGLQTTASGTSWWQWGDNPGFKNFVLAEPARQWAIAVFTNGDNGRPVYERVIREARGDQPAFLRL